MSDTGQDLMFGGERLAIFLSEISGSDVTPSAAYRWVRDGVIPGGKAKNGMLVTSRRLVRRKFEETASGGAPE